MKTVSEILELLITKKGSASVYFLGIGGIGMSALARYFLNAGVTVSGYDKTPTALCRKLEAEGAVIHYEDNIEFIDKEAKLVIYTPAVPKDHLGLNWYLSHNYTVAKRSDVLGAITATGFNICIAGTHGKTTTSTMVAHILRHSGYGCNAFLGGIAVNYDTNFWASDNEICVAEADEYDRSFLKLNPDIAIISSMDADHLDIYGTAENMEQAFIAFTENIRPRGVLISKYGLQRSSELKAPVHYSYAVQNTDADIYATNIEVDNGSYRFDVRLQGKCIKAVQLNMGGMHNVENATAAIAVAVQLGIDEAKIKAAVAGFKGVKRRFEYIIKTGTQVMIDDYAHHPEELKALITGAKAMFADKKCTVVFQPHLYSRTKDHAAGFAEVLDEADEVMLLPVYPAREQPMEGVSSYMILEKMKHKNAQVFTKQSLLNQLKATKPEFLITAGAGDIDTLVGPIKEVLEER
ncbi:MAG TPA: UDP-N-acetylmuramate--L-alanine ligase [Ferruginibacter sp.]|nr:UDP-N-acetylmuramate--L-alanine ligase [Ferruginibacter sp.]HMP20989.1 UDP-N-acetylmuramate--L-alanine ligase [Ferruginibacter sp.]